MEEINSNDLTEFIKGIDIEVNVLQLFCRNLEELTKWFTLWILIQNIFVTYDHICLCLFLWKKA